MENKYLIQMDTRLGWLNRSIIDFNQLSVGTCLLEFELTDNRVAYDLTDKRVMIEVLTPSGATKEEEVTVIEALTGKFEKVLSAGMITEQGIHYLELSIYSADNVKLLCTGKARYSIGENYGEKNVVQSSQYSTLQQCIMDVKTVEGSVGVSADIAGKAQEDAEKAKLDSATSATNSIQSSIASQRSAESAQATAGTLDTVVEMAQQSAEASKQSSEASQQSANAAESAKNSALQAVAQAGQSVTVANQAVINVEKAVQDVEQSKIDARNAEISAESSARSAQQAESSANTSKAILEEKIPVVDNLKDNVNNTVSTANMALSQANTAIQNISNLTTVNQNMIAVAEQNTARADEAILKATDANNVAGQKLIDTTAQANIAKAEAVKATTQANRAKTEADRAGSAAIVEVQKHVTLNGSSQTNFDFGARADKTIDKIRVAGVDYKFAGEKGDKGEPGTASVAIDDAVTNAQQTWSSTKIYDKIREPIYKPSVVSNNKTKKAMMTFIDDDGRNDSYTKWKPIIVEKNVPITIPLVTSRIGVDDRFLTWEQCKELQALGVEFCSHTHTHTPLTDLGEAEIKSEFEQSQNLLIKNGMQYNVLVYPGGNDNALIRKLTREYFRTGIDITEGLNTIPLKTYGMTRRTMAEDGYNTLEYYKQQVDECISNNGWLIWKTHSQYPSFDDTQIELIKQVIDYARSRGVDIVNVNDGLDSACNIIDIGDYPNGEYTIIDADGFLHSKSNAIQYKVFYDDSIKIDTLITYFAKNSKTSNIITIAIASGGFPEGKGGILDTYRGHLDSYSYQEYRIYNTNVIYKRVWNGNSWNNFEKISAENQLVVNSSVDEFLTSNIPSDFAAKSIVYTRISTANADLANFPLGKAGVLITNNLYTDNYCTQEYELYSNKRKYRRSFIGSTWTKWEAVQTCEEFVLKFDFGTISSMNSKDCTITLDGLTQSDRVICSPIGVFPIGLIYSSYNNITNKVTIRILNTTSNNVTYSADFNVKVLRS